MRPSLSTWYAARIRTPVEEGRVRSFRSSRSVSIFLLAGLIVSVPALAQVRRTVTIPFPRGGFAVVSLTHGPLLIRSVTLRNRPSSHEIRRAARRDPDNTKVLAWVFRVANAGRRDWHARIVVNVLDRGGRILASNDRNAEIDARDFHDRITVFTRIRTLDYPRADRAQIYADFFRY